MKKSVVIMGLGALAAAIILAGCLDSGGGASSYKGPLLRYHYSGRAGIGRDGTAAIFKRIEALPETAALRTHLGRRLGSVANTLWRDDLPSGAEPQPELLRPLVEDATSVESLIDVRGSVGKAETLIAAELAEDRARLWETNLVQLAKAWKLGAPTPLTVEGVKGWTIRRPQGAGLQLFRAGKWTLVGIGPDRIPALNEALQQAARSGRPMPATRSILDLQADLPKLGKWFPLLTRYPLAPVQLSMIGSGDNVRTEMKMMYSGRIPWKFEPWQIPTNLVGEPLTSFTVAQGVRPFLEKVPGLTESGVTLPNQYCVWGAFHLYGHTFFAYPQANASNTLARLYPRFGDLMQHYFDRPIGQFLFVTNRGEIAWGGGLPGISPTLAWTKQANGQEFIHARLFPLMPNRKAPPAELFTQFAGRTNLFYYDWELTSNRVDVARQLYSLGNIFDRRPPPPHDSPSQRWLRAVGPLTGNAVTEITQTSPQELQLVRKSQTGLTGFEMVTLSAWLESEAFPREIVRQREVRLDQIKRSGPPPVRTPGR